MSRLCLHCHAPQPFLLPHASCRTNCRSGETPLNISHIQLTVHDKFNERGLSAVDKLVEVWEILKY
jgi:hypothetical protein